MSERASSEKSVNVAHLKKGKNHAQSNDPLFKISLLFFALMGRTNDDDDDDDAG